MGLERVIHYRAGIPPWEAVRSQLARTGDVPALRMIDGLPAFPDEVPVPGWKELRLGFPAGMVSIRRDTDTLFCVVWGNAEAPLRSAWDRLAWAAASAGDGLIVTQDGLKTPAQFAAEVGITFF
ncbi:MAG: hypothetical protein K2P78_05495 [Gemmataceae bacterium]|nr:hypothetical protein [Gemmataceae bacterium]